MREMTQPKPQDVLVLLKLLANPFVQQKEVAYGLKLSTAEVSNGIKRLRHAGLLGSEGLPNLDATSEFLIHAVKYLCPPEIGSLGVGIPTGHSYPGQKEVHSSLADAIVWPHAKGTVRGIVLRPIYPTVPDAALEDDNLYALASMLDMLRVGRAREKAIGAKLLLAAIKKLSNNWKKIESGKR